MRCIVRGGGVGFDARREPVNAAALDVHAPRQFHRRGRSARPGLASVAHRRRVLPMGYATARRSTRSASPSNGAPLFHHGFIVDRESRLQGDETRVFMCCEN